MFPPRPSRPSGAARAAAGAPAAVDDESLRAALGDLKHAGYSATEREAALFMLTALASEDETQR